MTFSRVLQLLTLALFGVTVTHASRAKPSRHASNLSSDNSLPPCVPFVVSQPLNHFGPSPANFDQHLCVVSEYFDANSEVEPSVFFYVGNESPLEEYVNNTGETEELE